MADRGRPIRWVEAVRGAWGAALLIAPAAVLRLLGVRVDRPALVVARILGARQLGQAALSGIAPSPEVMAMGVWVDGVHAGTAVGWALVDPARARAGLLDAAIAAVFARFGLDDLRAATPARVPDSSWRDLLARKVLRRVPFGKRLQQLTQSRTPSGHR